LGASVGEAMFYLVEDFHGLSTMIEGHARAAHQQFGKSSQAMAMPVTTLHELCRRHAPPVFEFLKVDVEGAEQEVLLNGDWQSFRPKVVVAEALAPYTLAPAWPAWEPFLAKQGYRCVWFDSLNRYYLADEASELAHCLETAPCAFEEVFQFRTVKPALVDARHPDHRLAKLLAGSDMTHLPLPGRDLLLERVPAGIRCAATDQAAGADAIPDATERPFRPQARAAGKGP